jgi:DNA-binding transcriptional MerR regulator
MKITIGKVAKLAGVNIQTIRFYERKGLVPAIGRKGSDMVHSGYRIYNEDAVRKIQFIKNAQRLGFTLKEIASLLNLRVSQRGKCGSVKRKAEIKLKEVQEKMVSLKALEKALLSLIRACHSQAPTESCPILKSLEMKNGRNKR